MAAHADIQLGCANLAVVHRFSKLPISTKDFHHSEWALDQRHHARIEKCQDDNEDESLQEANRDWDQVAGFLQKTSIRGLETKQKFQSPKLSHAFGQPTDSSKHTSLSKSSSDGTARVGMAVTS